VAPDLTIPGHPEVFVLGDMAAVNAPDTGAPVPGVAQAALQMGAFAGRAIADETAGRQPPAIRPTFRYVDRGSMAVIGKARAVVQMRRLHFSGFIAWLIWGAVHIAFLVDFRDRVRVLLSWLWNWLSNSRDVRIIMGDSRLDITTPLPGGFVRDSEE
jgi:NADH dehydrogenase